MPWKSLTTLESMRQVHSGLCVAVTTEMDHKITTFLWSMSSKLLFLNLVPKHFITEQKSGLYHVSVFDCQQVSRNSVTPLVSMVTKHWAESFFCS